MKKAVACYWTSSVANVGDDKVSLKHQQRAVDKYAKNQKMEIVFAKYDDGKSGATSTEERRGIGKLLKVCQEKEIHTILVENASRFFKRSDCSREWGPKAKGIRNPTDYSRCPRLF